MNIWHHQFFFFEFEKKLNFFLKKMRRKEFTSLNASQSINNLLCNLKRRTQVASSITFVKIVYYIVFSNVDIL